MPRVRILCLDGHVRGDDFTRRVINVAKRKPKAGSGKAPKKRAAVAKRLEREAERMGLTDGTTTERYVEAKSANKRKADPRFKGLRSKGGAAQHQGGLVNLRTGRR